MCFRWCFVLGTTKEFIQKVGEIASANGVALTSKAETEPFKGIAPILAGLWHTMTGKGIGGIILKNN